MSALAIAHKALKGDLNNTITYDINEANNYLYLHKSDDYFTLRNKTVNGGLTYISTVEEFNNFKGDNMTDNIYTQEMADNGVLPDVGMKFEIHEGEAIEIMLPFDPTRFTVGKNKDGEYGLYSRSEIKPLTLPITLIDGECYQFNSPSGNLFKGYYTPIKGLFVAHRGNFDAHLCTNIQPLTVETKS